MPRRIADVASPTAAPDARWALDGVKRGTDIVVSGLLIVLTLPLLLAATLILACEGPGPILVGRPRVGRDGVVFGLLRFRTAPAKGPQDAVSPVGRFLRATQIVTLPQLLNVFRGDMSLVGPQPLPPDVAERRSRAIPGYDRRCAARPGVTGNAQLRQPHVESLADARIALHDDLDYVAHASPTRDLRIMAQTLRMALAREEPR